jgi:hypothetical protein
MSSSTIIRLNFGDILSSAKSYILTNYLVPTAIIVYDSGNQFIFTIVKSLPKASNIKSTVNYD